ncbi:GNAT family N-acetyltransferase [Rathayibacter sp. VKM Ac-2760]|uniref:GNAT family N-acetyltransferase n=1 Tax=Rathayibacter sp. VKM Ac-2760 TaxID=2609253 RepID=UPI0013174005|nr:GNAT family N-acetyltransferase [Rathayibacter sp. VKM Ac-2760]QHC59112.1 GNAT family N-acetyltransferase [Rathayibacter sp. VKM Ac-2760]
MSDHPDPVLRIRELRIPERPGADGWADFVALTAIGNAVEAEGTGTAELGFPAEINLGEWRQQEFDPRRAFLAEVVDADGVRAVGSGELHWSTEEGDDAAWLALSVLPAERRRGVGTALLERLTAEAHGLGRSVLQTWTAHRAERSGERLAARSGTGSVPSGDIGARWLSARGWVLEQVERVSVARLPLDATLAASRRRGALAHADGYELRHWSGATPDELIEGMLVLRASLSAQAPTAGLSVPEETWTPERLEAHDLAASAGGRVELTSVALHDGRPAGYCTVDVLPGRAALWGATLVLPEHRGHRLGMLLKLDALEHLAAADPDCRAVYTWNAEENRPMLAVNEAVGFTAIAVEGQWRLDGDRA